MEKIAEARKEERPTKINQKNQKKYRKNLEKNREIEYITLQNPKLQREIWSPRIKLRESGIQSQCARTVRTHKTRFLDGKDDGQQARIGQSPQTAQVTAPRPHIFSHLFIYMIF
jgi:hypothetical protein